MNNKLIAIILSVVLLAMGSSAFAALLIDNFSAKSLKAPVEWWVFDCKPDVSKGNLAIKGQAKSWYAGGVGTYIAKENQDLSQFNAIKLDIIGNGGGNLKIELADDDNGNWDYEQNVPKGFIPTKDDRWVYEQRIDWRGPKTVIIPFAEFQDENPMVGDDKQNFEQKGGSGGLLQIQFIFLGNKADGKIDLAIDNIYLIKE